MSRVRPIIFLAVFMLAVDLLAVAVLFIWPPDLAPITSQTEMAGRQVDDSAAPSNEVSADDALLQSAELLDWYAEVLEELGLQRSQVGSPQEVVRQQAIRGKPMLTWNASGEGLAKELRTLLRSHLELVVSTPDATAPATSRAGAEPWEVTPHGAAPGAREPWAPPVEAAAPVRAAGDAEASYDSNSGWTRLVTVMSGLLGLALVAVGFAAHLRERRRGTDDQERPRGTDDQERRRGTGDQERPEDQDDPTDPQG